MLVAISRAPYPKIAAFHKRMGWPFKWVSSNGNDFNFDYHVSFTEADKARGKAFYNFEEQPYMSDELPGYSVFTKDEFGQDFPYLFGVCPRYRRRRDVTHFRHHPQGPQRAARHQPVGLGPPS